MVFLMPCLMNSKPPVHRVPLARARKNGLSDSITGASESDDCLGLESGRLAEPALTSLALQNLSRMRMLERIATKFNEAGTPLLLLKGGALLLTLYDRLDARAMDDLDLMVRPQDFNRAMSLLEELGAVQGASLVRDDFCPRFHYEVEYFIGEIHPVRLDLHVRPFRPLRYSRTVPDDAFWSDALTTRIGQASILVPSAEGMLIHLAVHAAVHGFSRATWLRDIADWAGRFGPTVDWDLVRRNLSNWRLAHPFREAIARVENEYGSIVPADFRKDLSTVAANWRDRLTLRQAPKDANRPVAHVLVNAVSTPGCRFVLSYLWAVGVPGRAHMAGWYGRKHWGWFPTAHALRLVWPVWSRVSARRPRQKLGTPDIRSDGQGWL